MCGKGLLRRVLPFFLTFFVGLFIASFFVSIAAPRFQFNRGWRRDKQYHRMMEFENQRLREDNLRLQKLLTDRESQNSSESDFDLKASVPPPPPMPPMPPARVQTIPYRIK